MKLSKLFHTLYATVMALPVLIIPIFALNILHKETEPISITVQEKEIIDFNQQVNEIQTQWNPIASYSFGALKIEGSVAEYKFTASNTFTMLANNQYLCIGYENSTFADFATYLSISGGSNITIKNDSIITMPNESTANYSTRVSPNIEYDITVYPQVYNLTQMFGAGNEPTYEEFKEMFPSNYYAYTESKQMLVNTDIETLYAETDIGSQFVYALYKPVNDYFNFGEFFGLSGMYDWFQLNIFNGTAPLSFFIVFNVMIYWLFISLFWLIFDILIYVPMVIHKWLDKAEM